MLAAKKQDWNSHKYQAKAVSFLLENKEAGLFLDPGLGKTSTSLATIKILKYAGQIDGVLIVAPLRVIHSVWPNEINKWLKFNNLTYTILHGHKGKASLFGDKKDIYLINPEGLGWLHQELFNNIKRGKKCPFNCLWIDESTKFKSPTSKRFGFLRDMLPLFHRRHIMTGTPVPKGMLDLWSQFYIMDKGHTLGSNFNKFRRTYFQQGDFGSYSWKVKHDAVSKINNMIAPKVMEMSSKDYLKLPDKIYNNITVKLPPAAERKYRQMEQYFFVKIEESEVTAMAVAAAGMKCHQIANGRVYEDETNNDNVYTTNSSGIAAPLLAIAGVRKERKSVHVHSAKIEALRELVSELNGKPLLVAYQYKHDLKAIQEEFGKNVPYIGSGVNAKEANSIIKRWSAGEIPILLGHPSSMSHGLNLQGGGNDVCWFSLTWNLEEYLQFNARIHRQGVKGAVRVHHIMAENTIDEAMLDRLNAKEQVQKDLRAAIKAYQMRKKVA